MPTSDTAEHPLSKPDKALFFELSADLFCVAGYDGYFKLVNPAVCRLLGYTAEELYSQPINHFIYEPDREITTQYRETLKKNIPLQHYENRYQAKNGNVFWLSWTSIPMDEQQLIYAIAKNITHKKQTDAERNALVTRLTGINQKLKQLNYTTSHDLRSPVNNLLSVFELLNADKIQDPETLAFVEMLKSATQNLKETLNNYVDELQQHDSLHVELEYIPLYEMYESVTNSLRSLLENTRTSVFTDFEAMHSIYFNRPYLESIFLNMITNSVKYGRPDLNPVINIRSEIVDGQPRLHFSDNGQGLDMEQVKDKIFGLNQTFHDHSDSKGIGLYLVYNHITSLGGHIAVESKPNEGVHFTMTFKSAPEAS